MLKVRFIDNSDLTKLFSKQLRPKQQQHKQHLIVNRKKTRRQKRTSLLYRIPKLIHLTINRGRNRAQICLITSTMGKSSSVSKMLFSSFSESTWRLYSEHQRTLREKAKAILVKRGGYPSAPPVKYETPPTRIDSRRRSDSRRDDRDHKPRMSMPPGKIKLLKHIQMISRYAAGYAPRNATSGHVSPGNGSSSWYASAGYGSAWNASWNATRYAAWNGASWYATSKYAFPAQYATTWW